MAVEMTNQSFWTDEHVHLLFLYNFFYLVLVYKKCALKQTIYGRCTTEKPIDMQIIVQ